MSAHEVGGVVGPAEAEGLAQSSRAAAQRVIRRLRVPAAVTHDLDPSERRQRPEQHPSAHSGRLADDIGEVVDSVGEVDLKMSGRAKQRCVPTAEPAEAVARGIIFRIGLDLDDATP